MYLLEDYVSMFCLGRCVHNYELVGALDALVLCSRLVRNIWEVIHFIDCWCWRKHFRRVLLSHIRALTWLNCLWSSCIDANIGTCTCGLQLQGCLFVNRQRSRGCLVPIMVNRLVLQSTIHLIGLKVHEESYAIWSRLLVAHRTSYPIGGCSKFFGGNELCAVKADVVAAFCAAHDVVIPIHAYRTVVFEYCPFVLVLRSDLAAEDFVLFLCVSGVNDLWIRWCKLFLQCLHSIIELNVFRLFCLFLVVISFRVQVLNIGFEASWRQPELRRTLVVLLVVCIELLGWVAASSWPFRCVRASSVDIFG